MSEHQLYLCPTCQAEVAVIPGHVGMVPCPHCGEMFVLAGQEESGAAGQAPAHDAELDADRIHRLAMLRRSAYRSRSYCLIAAGGCLGGAAELIFNAVQLFRQAGGMRRFFYALLFLLAAALLLAAGGHFARLARRHHLEAKQSALEEPTEPPDFSTLRDGSQMAENLENMQGEKSEIRNQNDESNPKPE